MHGTLQHRPVHTADHSVGELVRQASEQLSDLVRQEMRLAQREMAEKGKRAGIGGGMLGGAALMAIIALQAMAATAIAALSLALPVWASGLIVTGALLVIAGMLALVGKKQVGRATPAMPRRTLDSVKTDIEQLKERAHR